MPAITKNHWRGGGLLRDVPGPSTDIGVVERLLALCPAHRETPLRASPELAGLARVGMVWVKDERTRMGLGSFKALGAAYAIACAAAERGPDRWETALAGQTFVAASAGNHGLSVAAGARIFGARAVIYIADTVPDAFATRLRTYGAVVMREGADYEASMAAAETAAEVNGWTLLSDSSWEGYDAPARQVMEGYLQMAAEAARQMPETPSHILLQAGVGGMAAAVAAHARRVWRDIPCIIVVEPDHAPALRASIEAGKVVTVDGPASAMGRLDCKTPSLVALAGLSRDADAFATVSEEEAASAVATLAEHGFGTTPSGGAGLAALLAGLDLGAEARVLTILSEGPEDG